MADNTPKPPTPLKSGRYRLDGPMGRWEHVRDEYNRRSGEHISITRVKQIHDQALRKIRQRLAPQIGKWRQ